MVEQLLRPHCGYLDLQHDQPLLHCAGFQFLCSVDCYYWRSDLPSVARRRMRISSDVETISSVSSASSRIVNQQSIPAYVSAVVCKGMPVQISRVFPPQPEPQWLPVDQHYMIYCCKNDCLWLTGSRHPTHWRHSRQNFRARLMQAFVSVSKTFVASTALTLLESVS